MARMIPQETLEEIMQRSDIVDVVGEYVQLRKRGRNLFGLCPFHHEDTPSFSVNSEKQIYKCFGCGKGGNVISFVQEVEHLSFTEAARKLAERCGVVIPERELSPAEQAKQAERQSMLAAHAAAADFYAAKLRSSRTALAYMKKRGIDEKMAVRFGLGSAPEDDWQALYKHLHQQGFGDELLLRCGLVSRSAKNGQCYDKFHGRLIFPIRDQLKTVVAFGGRTMGDEQPKYLNSQTTPIYNKSQLLYGLDLAADAVRSTQQIVVMEGYMDVLTAHSVGVNNAVAALGTAFTAEHIRLLNRYRPEAPDKLQVVLAFDGDAAGQKAARMSLEKLAEADSMDARVAVFPQELDPDDFLRKYGLHGWRQLLERRCYPRLDYLLLKALENRDPQTAADKGAVVAELLPALRHTRSNTERDSFIRELARRLRISEDAIRADLGESQAVARRSEQQEAKPYRDQIYRPGRPANRQLLIMSLSDRELFYRARKELGENFASTDEEEQLIRFIEQLGDEYDFIPSSLFNYISEENEGLRSFLLKLLHTDVPSLSETAPDDYIRTIRKHLMEQRLAELQRRIAAAESSNEDVDALIAQKLQLSRELREL